MEAVLDSFVKKHSLDEIVAGAPINLDDVNKANKEKVVAILIHCCVNGPVSPHKITNYPIIGEQCLDDLVGHKVSNNGLRKSCEKVAMWLSEQGFKQGYMFEKHGGFWPANSFGV